MIFRQLVTRSTERMTYLVACARTREAILIDPVDGDELRYRSLATSLRVRLTCVIDTALPEAPTGVVSYSSLLDFLGTGDEVRTRKPLHEILGTDRIGPLASLDDEADRNVQEVEYGNSTRRLAIHHKVPPQRAQPVFDNAVNPLLFVRVGTLRVDVWAPTVNHLVVHLADRVITGCPALAGAPADFRSPVFASVLALPADTLVFPRTAPHRTRISSVAQEREWLSARAADTDDVLPFAPRSARQS